MKKIIPVLLCLLIITGCSHRMFTPVINTDFKVEAVCKAGDFSYSCLITRKDNVITVEPISTRAKGMKMIFDGKNITFKKGKFTASYESAKVDSTNLAKIVYCVFEYLENAENLDVKRVDDQFEYVGKTPIGDFVLIQNSDNSLDSLYINDANISVKFIQKN